MSASTAAHVEERERLQAELEAVTLQLDTKLSEQTAAVGPTVLWSGLTSRLLHLRLLGAVAREGTWGASASADERGGYTLLTD